jgi:hypothetical protein
MSHGAAELYLKFSEENEEPKKPHTNFTMGENKKYRLAQELLKPT